MDMLKKRTSEAEAIGLTFIGPYRGAMEKTPYHCPKHGSIWQTPNKVQQGMGCQKCGREKQQASRRLGFDRLRDDAKKVGLEFVGGFISTVVDATYFCAVHGEIRMSPASVRRGSSCRRCSRAGAAAKRRKPKAEKPIKRIAKLSIATLESHAHAVGLKYADGYVPAHGRAQYICEAHGQIEMSPAVVKRGGGCRFCAGNTLKSLEHLEAEASAIGLRFIGPYKGDSVRTVYECPQHGLIQKRPGEVKSGKVCGACAKFGFDPVAPATFYIYRVDRITEPSFIGYGLSKDFPTRNRAHKVTFRHAGASADLLCVHEIESGRAAADLELHIRSQLRAAHFDTGLRGFREEAVHIDAEPLFFAALTDWLAGSHPP